MLSDLAKKFPDTCSNHRQEIANSIEQAGQEESLTDGQIQDLLRLVDDLSDVEFYVLVLAFGGWSTKLVMESISSVAAYEVSPLTGEIIHTHD